MRRDGEETGMRCRGGVGGLEERPERGSDVISNSLTPSPPALQDKPLLDIDFTHRNSNHWEAGSKNATHTV